MINDKRKALGRGLDSLLPGRPAITPIAMPAAQPSGSTQEIPIDSIDPNPYQTRRRINEAALEELAESIRASGVVQPVVLRPAANGRYQLVAGERRWHASKRAGKTTIPAVVRQISNEQAMEITIIENLQREDLNPVEQARALATGKFYWPWQGSQSTWKEPYARLSRNSSRSGKRKIW